MNHDDDGEEAGSGVDEDNEELELMLMKIMKIIMIMMTTMTKTATITAMTTTNDDYDASHKRQDHGAKIRKDLTRIQSPTPPHLLLLLSSVAPPQILSFPRPARQRRRVAVRRLRRLLGEERRQLVDVELDFVVFSFQVLPHRLVQVLHLHALAQATGTPIKTQEGWCGEGGRMTQHGAAHYSLALNGGAQFSKAKQIIGV